MLTSLGLSVVRVKEMFLEVVRATVEVIWPRCFDREQAVHMLVETRQKGPACFVLFDGKPEGRIGHCCTAKGGGGWGVVPCAIDFTPTRPDVRTCLPCLSFFYQKRARHGRGEILATSVVVKEDKKRTPVVCTINTVLE